jgi:hypothetical protein
MVMHNAIHPAITISVQQCVLSFYFFPIIDGNAVLQSIRDMVTLRLAIGFCPNQDSIRSDVIDFARGTSSAVCWTITSIDKTGRWYNAFAK